MSASLARPAISPLPEAWMPLTLAEPAEQGIWRVGNAPDPWAWTDWKWATGHHFDGRWDDLDGTFRSIYAGASLYSCFVELLAPLRPDPQLAEEIAAIVADPEDVEQFPTTPAGDVDPSWLDNRVAGTATLTGAFCDVTTSTTIATLRPSFATRATELGLNDFDVSALNDAAARPLTQAIATRLCRSTDLDGIRYTSRHGSDLTLWAIFERSINRPPRCIDQQQALDLTPTHPELLAAFATLGLRWLLPDADLPAPTIDGPGIEGVERGLF
ncbi:hypothetical protein [Naumannella huperziae]